MAKLPTPPRLPWREKDIKSGDPALLADYLKALVKVLQKAFSNIHDIVNLNSNSGLGDMLKSVYDTNDDGKVDNAEQADNADKLDDKEAIDFLNIDGSTSPTTDIDWGGYKITNLGSPTDILDAVNEEYLAKAVSTIGSRYYMTDVDSGIEDYKLCSTNPPSSSEQSISATDVVDGQYIGGWISPNTGEPSNLLTGVFNWRVYAEKTGGQKTLRLYWKLVERKSDNSEVVIGTSIASNEVITGKNSYIIPLTLDFDYEIAPDSYILCKIYALVSGNGNNPSLKIYYQGASASHFQIPVNTEILDNRYYTKTEAENIFLDKSTYDSNDDGVVDNAEHANTADSLGDKTISSVVANVDTIFDLLLIDTSNLETGEQYYVLGYHSKNDGGEGVFFWDANESKSNHNGGTIIDPNVPFPTNWDDINQRITWFTPSGGGNGCWKRLYGNVGFIFPEWFGAKGDNLCDDFLPMQKFFSNINLYKNYGYLIKGKRYLVSDNLSISSETTIKGNYAKIIFTNDSSKILINGDNINIESVDVSRNTENDVDIELIYIYRSNKVNIKKCLIHNNYYIGLGVAGSSFVTIDNNLFYNTGKKAVTAEGGAAIWCGDYNGEQNYNIIIKNNKFFDLNWSAIYLNASHNSIVEGNLIRDTHESSIYVNSTTSYCNICNNIIDTTNKKNISACGIELDAPSYITVENNLVQNVDDSSISLTDIRSCIVCNNQLYFARKNNSSFPQGSLIQILSNSNAPYLNHIIGNNLYQPDSNIYAYAAINIVDNGGGNCQLLHISNNSIAGFFDVDDPINGIGNIDSVSMIYNNLGSDVSTLDINNFALTDLSNVSDSTVLSKVKAVDGSGSGLDADTVDGNHASAFANTSLSNVSNSTVLSKVKAVDGSGSGLDADYVRGLPADFTASLSGSGYQKLPSGIIINWGTVHVSSAGVAVTWNYPKAFSSNVFVVLTNPTGKYGHTQAFNETTTSCKINSDTSDIYVRCLAIGK